MLFKLYLGFDKVSKQFGNIYRARSDGEAIRQHETMLREAKDKNKHFNTGDIILCRVGEIEDDTNTGVPEIINPGTSTLSTEFST